MKIAKLLPLKVYPLSLNSFSETKIAEFANSVHLDEVAHNEPPHLDLHYLHSVVELSI